MTALSETKRYQAYPEYKDSDVEWLDDIPKDWCTRRLKHMLESPMSYGANEAAERAVSTEPRYIRITDMNSDGTLKEDTFRSLPRDIASDYLLKDRDILLARSGATVGKSFIYRKEFGDCCFAGYLIKVSCDSARLNSDYAFWFFQSSSYWQYISGSQIQATIQNVSAEKYGEMYISLPEHVEEQTQIANFLDHETAKIDTLIEKQQQLIKLLKEKRQAVISHAVTKGLNPQAPMKDSGVEWLGEVPEHWDVCKLSYRYEVLLGKMLDEKKISGNYLGKYLRNTDVQWDSINTDNLPEMDFRPQERERYSVKKGDLIVCEGGEIGRCGIWESESTCFYQKALHRLRPLYNTDLTRFMFYVLFDAVHQERFISGAGKATIAHLPAETFKQYRFAFPPRDEQQSIIDFLDSIKGKFDLIENKAQLQIELLKERRTALISAAVAGKIDVRNWQAPISQNQALEQTA